jgi:DNA-binding NtrC family response regulator
VVELDLPPLRERGADVQLIAREFLARFAKDNGKKLDGFDDTALDWINTYQWPGNVRELRNAVEKAVIMARGPRVTLEDMTSRRHRITGEYAQIVSVPVGSSLAETRRQLVLKTFASSNGDLDRTAKTIGVSVPEVRAEIQSMLERRVRDGQDNGAGDGDAVAAAEGPVLADGPPMPAVTLPPDASPVGKAPGKPAGAGRARKTG